MEVFALSGLINAVIAFTISILVFARNRKNSANKTFSLFALLVALWSLGYWRWLAATGSEAALFWAKFLTAPSVFIPALYFHWIVLLMETKDQKHWPRLLYAIYSVAIILLLILFPTRLLISGVEPRLFFPFWPIPGTLYLPFIGIYSAVIIYSLILLFKNSKSLTDETHRKQLLFVFIGTLAGFGGAATNFFLWYNIPIPPYGNLLVSLGLIIWGYGAAKYHLFNIRAVIAEILTFIIWMAVLVELLLANNWPDRLISAGLLAIVIGLGIIIIRSVHKEVEQRERLEQLDKLKSEFLSFASHQVKTPMTAIKGYASLIADGTMGTIPDKVKETADKLQEIADRTIRLVTEFLDLSKIEEGKMKYRFSEVNLVELVKNIVAELKVMAQQKNLDLSLNLPATEIKIKADEEKLRQVIQNLVENAIKYTENGFVKVELKPAAQSVLITITDSGFDISSDLLPKLFQRFSRDAKTATKIRGTGLGLYIAKEIITAHQGKIWAESEGEGKGARFGVEVPK